MVELVDTPDLGSGIERCGGSSPPLGTKIKKTAMRGLFCARRGREPPGFDGATEGAEMGRRAASVRRTLGVPAQNQSSPRHQLVSQVAIHQFLADRPK